MESWYLPKFSEQGVREPVGTFLERLRQAGITHPPDVLQQWFFEHWESVSVYDWLDLLALRFEERSWTTAEVPGPEISSSGFGETNIARYAEVRSTPRFAKIESFLKEHGTWPRPLIVLENPGGTLQPPMASWCRSPLNLIEGHHRLVVFNALRGIVPVDRKHVFWSVSATLAVQPTPARGRT